MAQSPILQITDFSSDGTVNIIESGMGVHLSDWTPSIADIKDGGIWRGGPLTDGRRMVHSRWANIVDTFELKINAPDQDTLIAITQKLRRLLQKAREYWTTSWQNEPVWIKARGSCEENTRYAVIMDWRLQMDDNPYAQPMRTKRGKVAMDNITMILEHGLWRADMPGSATCVAVSGEQDWTTLSDSEMPGFSISADDDDGSIDFAPLVYGRIDTSDDLIMGDLNFRSVGIFLRFLNVTVPQGALITSAVLQFKASATSPNAAGSPSITIQGEDVDSSGAYTTGDNYFARAKTTATASWWNVLQDGRQHVKKWTSGTTYTTVDFANVIQEIVDRSGWASGNDLSLFLTPDFYKDTDWANEAYDNESGDTTPLLVIGYTIEIEKRGREATCSDEVYIVNKSNQANISHAYYFDATVGFSGNLITGGIPHDLFPAGVADGDMIYFGVQTSLANSGPFNNLVFDIGTATVWTSPAVLIWEYFDYFTNGWETLYPRDNTDNLSTCSFTKTGVNSIHFQHPELWGTTNINGIAAWWVRVRVDMSGGGSVTVCTQKNRPIYTAVWPYLGVDELQIGGDIPALMRYRLTNQSQLNGNPYLSSAFTDHMVYGARSITRGADFSAYINISDQQSPSGLSVADLTTDTQFATYWMSPLNRCGMYSPTGVDVIEPKFSVTFSSNLAAQYRGTFRVFLRYFQDGGTSEDFTAQLRIYGGQVGAVVALGFAVGTAEVHAVDMGIFTIGTSYLTDSDVLFSNNMQLYLGNSNGSPGDLYLFDIIMIPVDETSIEIHPPEWGSNAGSATNGRLIDVDSIIYPKRDVRSFVRVVGTDTIVRQDMAITASPAVLQSNVDQRMWFFGCREVEYAGDRELIAPFETSHSVQVYKTQRYFSMRGNN